MWKHVSLLRIQILYKCTIALPPTLCEYELALKFSSIPVGR